MKKALFIVGLMPLAAFFAACGGPAADGRRLAEKACQCSKLDLDDSKAAEAEACIEEWSRMIEKATKKYADDAEKLAKFVEGSESVHCE
ncbi:MAG: hypothetical protein IJ745_00990 [Bacteroidales bacterium]|nr:hypothetical protein [Bacteroidales bacterium]